MKLPDELLAARMILAMERPYLASALWAITPVERPGLGTLAVDRFWRLYYDPEVVRIWTAPQLAAVLYHELCHLLRNHPERMDPLPDTQAAQFAADMEINDDLLEEFQNGTKTPLQLPGDPLTPAKFDLPPHRLAEEYYDALCRSLRRQGTGAHRRGQGKNAPQAGQQDQGTGTADNAKPAPGAGRCGSCAHGRPEPWEAPPPGEGSPPGIRGAAAEIIRRQVAEAIRESHRSRGNVPGHWRRWADAILSPRVNWRQELAGLIRHAYTTVAEAEEPSLLRPSRRREDPVFVFPSRRRTIPNVAVVVDTSGSVDDSLLAQALAEIAGILQALDAREGVHVLACDAAVHSCRQVFHPSQVELAGGGGTDMGVGLAAAARLYPPPDITVVLTDGQTPWPPTPPRGTRVIVGLLGDGEPEPLPKWAKVVYIQEPFLPLPHDRGR